MNPAETAQKMVEIIEDECKDFDRDQKRILANRIKRLIDDWASPPLASYSLTLIPMTDAEADVFGKRPFPFGKYEGEPTSEVPYEYLEWLADESRSQWKKFWSYLNSPRIKRIRNELSTEL